MLFLSKYYQRTAGSGGAHTIFKILIAEALSKDKLNNSHLILSIPEGYTIDLLKSISKSIKIHIYNSSSISIRTTRLSVFLLIVFVRIKQFLYGLKVLYLVKLNLVMKIYLLYYFLEKMIYQLTVLIEDSHIGFLGKKKFQNFEH